MSSVWGRKLTITVFGQSHADAIGVVVDGLPAGFRVDQPQIIFDGAGKHAVSLRNICKRASGCGRKRIGFCTAPQNGTSLLGLDQTKDHAKHGSLAFTGRTGQCNQITGTCRKVHVLQNACTVLIVEAYLLELQGQLRCFPEISIRRRILCRKLGHCHNAPGRCGYRNAG